MSYVNLQFKCMNKQCNKCLGPYATGCMELMTEYSSEGCFSRIFYPTDISPDELEVCKKRITRTFYYYYFN